MELSRFNISPEMQRDLGPGLVADVVGVLHSNGDCTICGKTLGDRGRFSLLSAEHQDIITIRPAHAACFSSSTKKTDVLFIAECSYRVLPANLPTAADQVLPVVMVNPSIDEVIVVRGEDGIVRDRMHNVLQATGWRAPEPTNMSQALPTAGRLEWTGKHHVRLSSPLGTWDADLPEPVAELARRDGIFAVVMRHLSVIDILNSPDPMGLIQAATDADDVRLGLFKTK